MNRARVIGCLLFLAILVFFTSLALSPVLSPVLAQFSFFDKTIKIDTNGRVYDGAKQIRPQWDILPEKHVFRYKVIEDSSAAFDSFRVLIQLPTTVVANEVRANIIAVHGVRGARIVPVDEHFLLAAAESVDIGSSITITVDLPSTAITFSTAKRLVVWIDDFTPAQWVLIALAMPMVVGIFFLFQAAVARKDIWLKPHPTPVTSPPSQLPPALVGTLINGYVGVREIAATLVDLARRGYIDIIYESEENFAFSQKRRWESDAKLREFEKLLLKQIFGSEEGSVITTDKQISHQLNAHLWSDAISRSVLNVYALLEELGYLKKNLRQVPLLYRFIGMLMFFGSVAGLGLTVYIFNDRFLLTTPWLVGLIFAPFFNRLALLAPRRTTEGREQAAQWLAFKNYLSYPAAANYTSERELFEPYLAYAIALGVETQWTGRFNSLAVTLPDWFFVRGTTVSTYSDLALTLFSIIGFVSRKFSFSRRPTAV